MWVRCYRISTPRTEVAIRLSSLSLRGGRRRVQRSTYLRRTKLARYLYFMRDLALSKSCRVKSSRESPLPITILFSLHSSRFYSDGVRICEWLMLTILIGKRALDSGSEGSAVWDGFGSSPMVRRFGHVVMNELVKPRVAAIIFINLIP
jgi:hypothetical protein